ncbi:hypothetical protein RSA31_21475 [Pantoea dispersa]|nr:hypothetical protein NS215_21775 [Pantoea dispersa]KTS85608.1 hypothetical protein RSA31_21475 [Pantoea dispersa]
MVGYRQVKRSNRHVRNMFQQYCCQPRGFAVRRINMFLLCQKQNKLTDQRTNRQGTAGFRHRCRAGFDKQKAGLCILCDPAAVRDFTRYPDSMSRWNKPQRILNLTAYCTAQRENKLTLTMSVRTLPGILARRRHMQGDSSLTESISIKLIRCGHRPFINWHDLVICCQFICIM